jgi:hypothetical protein
MTTVAHNMATTEQLHADMPLNVHGLELVSLQQDRVIEALSSPNGFLGMAGQCTLTDEIGIIGPEGDTLARLQEITPNLATLHRMNVFKRRTNPERDYAGMETTDPVRAYQILKERAEKAGNITLEVVSAEQVRRYGHMAPLLWKGARDLGNKGLIDEVIHTVLRSVIGVKNGLDGEIDDAMDEVDLINRLRPEGSAPAILIFRGGENAKSPNAWAEAYKRAHRRTKGMLVVDTAHGSEMAHTPNFEKSVEGQIESLDNLIRLSIEGFLPKGVLIEASDTQRVVDPPIPFNVAINGIIRLAEIAGSR